MDIANKVNEIMCWEQYSGETYEDVFARNGGQINSLPNPVVIDIVHAGGLQKWAETLEVKSKKELYTKLTKAVRTAICDPIFNDKKRVDSYPPLANFFYYAQRLDRGGKVHTELDKISDLVWNTATCRRITQRRFDKMFSIEPDPEKFKQAAKKMREIWDFSAKDIDALRYFVCQTRQENLNPSLNKSIYLWGTDKRTGKSTLARAFVTVLNGDIFDNFGTYESTLKKEMQFNDYELPLATLYNAVMLDEAMPKDTSKSYGQVKQMMTSNSCGYNQKFGAITVVKCRRYYIWTSNDDIAKIVQDEKERRLYAIKMLPFKSEMTFESIYDLIRDFCVNAVPEDDFQSWYNSFEYVDGLASKDRDEVIQEMALNKDMLFPTVGCSNVSAIQVARKMYKNEPTRDQRQAVKSAMELIFKSCKVPSNDYLFTTAKCREVINAMINDDGGKADEDLPF